MISKNKTLDKVYTAKDHSELMDAYKDWAGDYDNDTVDKFGYVAHIVASDRLHANLNDPSAVVLDAGCGTGLVGEVLAEKGYTTMDALDYSAEMLEEAKNKRDVYRDYLHVDLSKPLPMETDAYDAIVSAGTFTYGHVEPSAFEELVRITKKGGLITITIREGAYDDHGYPAKMEELVENGTWEQVEIRDEDYLKNESVGCKVCTFRVL